MLSLRPSSPRKCTPNLLPARLHHTGPAPSTQRYWTPLRDASGTQHAYFRGRHLHGTAVQLPDNYTGAVVRVTENTLQNSGAEDGEGENVEVMVAEQIGEFDEVVVWGHGGEVNENEGVLKGMREWVGFAEAMHGEGEEAEGEKADAKAGGT